jgi:hypothetical protein
LVFSVAPLGGGTLAAAADACSRAALERCGSAVGGTAAAAPARTPAAAPAAAAAAAVAATAAAGAAPVSSLALGCVVGAVNSSPLPCLLTLSLVGWASEISPRFPAAVFLSGVFRLPAMAPFLLLWTAPLHLSGVWAPQPQRRRPPPPPPPPPPLSLLWTSGKSLAQSTPLASPLPLDPILRRLGFGDLASVSCDGVSLECLPAYSDGAIPAAVYDAFAPFGGPGAREGGGPEGPPLGSSVCAPNAAAPPQPNQPPVYPTPPPPPQSDASDATAPPDAAGSPPAPPSTEQPAHAEDQSVRVETPIAPSEKPAITFHNVSIYKHRLVDKVRHTRLSHLSLCRGICP